MHNGSASETAPYGMIPSPLCVPLCPLWLHFPGATVQAAPRLSFPASQTVEAEQLFLESNCSGLGLKHSLSAR
jgi:hypothetical protein